MISSFSLEFWTCSEYVSFLSSKKKLVPKKLQVQVQDLQFRLTFNALLFSLYSIHLQIIFSLINVVSQVLQNFMTLDFSRKR